MGEPALGTNIVTQVGIIVRDVETKAKAWSEILGLPMPDIIFSEPMEKAHTEYKGKPTPGRVKQAFFRMGQVEIELIEPIDGPSMWKDQLDQHGESLHHVAFQIQGMKERAAYLEAQGVPLVQRGDFPGGRYAYLDGNAQLGCVVELLEND